MSLKNLGGLVFSTETGRLCPGCGAKLNACACANEHVPEGDGIVRIYMDKKGRKGKGVTLITGLCLANEELKTLAKELKKKCGVGGAVKDHNIEIQGDHRQPIQKLLQDRGYQVKLAGG